MFKPCRMILTAILAATVTPVVFANPIGFVQTNIASDQPGVANVTDPNLKNAWGIAASSTSPFWLGANGSGTSVLYNGNGAGTKLGLVVSIPGDGSVTGVAFNGTTSFNSNLFLFASEDGTVSGWRGALGTTAEVLQIADPANVYKSLTDGNTGGNEYVYLANFRSGNIDVLPGTGAPALAGNFTDPNLPAGYAPFDILNLGGTLYVTYAVQDATKHDDVSGAGNGIVDTFNLDGSFKGRLVTGGALNSPWGLALAPAGFGDVGGDLLVGNFGDGSIHAYNPTTGALIETLRDANGNPLAIDGLWGLKFGNGGNAGPTSTLFFTAGPDGESHGLFGKLTTAPEPATWLLTGSSLLALIARRVNKARSA